MIFSKIAYTSAIISISLISYIKIRTGYVTAEQLAWYDTLSVMVFIISTVVLIISAIISIWAD
jgi:uncharacterized membrane protein